MVFKVALDLVEKAKTTEKDLEKVEEETERIGLKEDALNRAK